MVKVRASTADCNNNCMDDPRKCGNDRLTVGLSGPSCFQLVFDPRAGQFPGDTGQFLVRCWPVQGTTGSGSGWPGLADCGGQRIQTERCVEMVTPSFPY